MIGMFQLGIMFSIARRRNYPREVRVASNETLIQKYVGSIAVVLLPVVVVGSVTFGIATASESAAIGVVIALLVGLIIVGTRSLGNLPESLRVAAMMSGKIMMIIAFSQLFVWILVLERVPEQIAAFVISLELGPVAVLLLINVIVLFLGTFIDVSPAILLLTPTLLPAAQAAGVSGLQFGIVLISGLAVGACTPPVGNCLNVGAAIFPARYRRSLSRRRAVSFANIVTLILISVFPALVTWLPGLWMN